MTQLTTEDVLNAIAAMSVLDVCDLVKKMEEKFGVSAQMPMVGVAPASIAAAPEVEEQTEFDVFLTGFTDTKKVVVIKAVREITGLGLKEAKDLVESFPCAVKEGISKADADAMRSKLQDAGASVEIK